MTSRIFCDYAASPWHKPQQDKAIRTEHSKSNLPFSWGDSRLIIIWFNGYKKYYQDVLFINFNPLLLTFLLSGSVITGRPNVSKWIATDCENQEKRESTLLSVNTEMLTRRGEVRLKMYRYAITKLNKIFSFT